MIEVNVKCIPRSFQDLFLDVQGRHCKSGRFTTMLPYTAPFAAWFWLDIYCAFKTKPCDATAITVKTNIGSRLVLPIEADSQQVLMTI